MFCCLGFALSCMIRNVDAAQPVILGIVLPLCFISGVFIPISELPAWLARIGSGYTITPHGTHSLTVKHGGLAFTTVHLNRDGNNTTFRVHGGGLILGRIINELGIARTVTEALTEGLGSAQVG